MSQKIGPVMLDIMDKDLTSEENDLLQHPLVGGVILFTRNYSSIEQLVRLCQSIRDAREGPLLIAVDQEGGRVQRFKDPFFTELPPMGTIGKWYDHSPPEGLALAEACGWVMAAELLAAGLDLSFAPVLDLDKGANQVIGSRAFHRDPATVTALAKAFIQGMNAAGMAATGKHFPGHGSVTMDSHLTTPVDPRDLTTVMADDMQPFIALQASLGAIMPAHIVFPNVDNKAVGFSEYWLQSILRTQLEFSGLIISDDLNMQGANVAGDYPARAEAALNAGCDMVLICNNRSAAIAILDHLWRESYSWDGEKFKALQGNCLYPLDTIHQLTDWQAKHDLINTKKVFSTPLE